MQLARLDDLQAIYPNENRRTCILMQVRLLLCLNYKSRWDQYPPPYPPSDGLGEGVGEGVGVGVGVGAGVGVGVGVVVVVVVVVVATPTDADRVGPSSNDTSPVLLT